MIGKCHNNRFIYSMCNYFSIPKLRLLKEKMWTKYENKCFIVQTFNDQHTFFLFRLKSKKRRNLNWLSWGPRITNSLMKFNSFLNSKLLEYFCSSGYLKARIKSFLTMSDVKKYAKFTILYSPNFLFDTTFACNQRQMLEWYSTYC